MTEPRELHIRVPVLARIEGGAALSIRIHDNRIEQADLNIFEPPRLFEQLLAGREYHEVPDMVARICGICPVAYQMSAVTALETLFELDAGDWVQRMRRVFYCGEWIQSHALHIHLLAAPDFLGFGSAPEMARDYPDEVRRGLELQALGNAIIRLFGGRSVHPVGARVGGFSRAPRRQQVQQLVTQLEQALPQAEALLRWTAALELPDATQDFCCVALRHPYEYPMLRGRLVSSHGLDCAIEHFEQEIREFQVPHSTALHALLDDKPYVVGPIARMNLNHDRLPQVTRTILDESGIHFPSHNMYHSIIARAAEIHVAILEALQLLQDYSEPAHASYTPHPRAGTGYGCSEAPRGILYHRYTTDERGNILAARIIPPTSQNQAAMEQDLVESLHTFGLQQPEQALRARAESVIRNYDPCISCATHFLRLRVEHD
jgi:coenzyme F420-reducing hydrogenase alpha subunit